MKRRLAYANVMEPVPQTARADKSQVLNDTGGYVFEVDDMSFVKRFLVLGTEGGTYYVTEKAHTMRASNKLINIIENRGLEVVQMIVDVSHRGLAIKNDAALFLLAMCTSSKNAEVKKAALEALTSVARIPTHLYHFLEFAKQFRGWGRAFKRTVANWMLSKDAENLAFIFTKYAQRDGYSAKDVLRLAKPKPITEDQDMVFKYIAKGILENNNESKAYQYLNAVETLKTLEKSKDIVALTEKFKIPMEIVPTDKRDKQVYSSVVKSAGMTWILRNLANLSRHDVINSNAEGREIVKLIQSKFTDEEQLRKARIHPIAILNALETYKKGNSRDNRWTVNSNILNVLNKAFYKSFEFVEPMNKRVYFGLDCSRSMYGTWSLKPDDILQPATIGACFALAFLKKESDVVFKGFNDTMQPINVHSECSLEEVIRTTQKVNWGSTNCALPMLDAMENNIPVDLFVILTDNDVNTGRIHPFEALKQYRKKMNINAKLVVMATSATLFTIADPSDAGMLDIVGFSPDVFTVIKNFVEL